MSSRFDASEASGLHDGGRPVLECRGLRKSFGSLVAVNGISFHISEGETYGLLGPNGAGKTTTISMVCGLLEQDEGEVLLDGTRFTPGSVKARAGLGLVPQELAVYPDLTARENLRFFARLYGLRGEDARRRIDEVLLLIGLTERADEVSKKYSGGMKRRLNVGIALLHRPRLLVLDEPTAGVDPQSRNAILEGVERLADEGVGILYTTHYMEEAERVCDRVGIVDAGEIKAEGTHRELVDIVGEFDQIQLTATGDLAAAVRALGEIGAVREASVRDGGIDLITVHAPDVLPDVFAKAAAANVLVRRVEVKEPNLEAVFLHLTGKALRD